MRTPVTAPAPTADNISVTWLAAGVDPVDIATLSGVNTPYAPSSYPAVPGTEGVAKVTAVGPAVENIAEGDLVIPVKVSSRTEPPPSYTTCIRRILTVSPCDI